MARIRHMEITPLGREWITDAGWWRPARERAAIRLRWAWRGIRNTAVLAVTSMADMQKFIK